MLSLHGLVIIATDYQEIPTKFGAVFKLEVGSETNPGVIKRHLLDVVIGLGNLEEAKAKFKIGTVLEITHAKWDEYTKHPNEDANKTYSKITIKADYKNIRFLKIPFYYEGLPEITQDKQGD